MISRIYTPLSVALTLGLWGCIDPDEPDLCGEGCGGGQPQDASPDGRSDARMGQSDARLSLDGGRADARPINMDAGPIPDARLMTDGSPDQDADDAHVPAPFVGGAGTLRSPWLIDSVEGLRAIEAWPDASFRLIADLDLVEAVGVHWKPLFGCPEAEPLCETPTPFTGTLDGGGHTLRRMSIGPGANFAGLFGLIRGGTVRNLTFIDPTVRGVAYVGTVAGALSGGPEVPAVVEAIRVIGADVRGGSSVGGLVGSMEDGLTELSWSQFHGDVEGATRTGGAVGLCRGDLFGVDTLGAVEALGGATGGVVGQLETPGFIRQSVAGGPAVTGNRFTGGLVGANFGGILEDVANEASVIGTINVGGLVGQHVNSGSILRGAHFGVVRGSEDHIGGLVGFLDDGEIVESLAVGIVTGPEQALKAAVVGRVDSGQLFGVLWDAELTRQDRCAGNGPFGPEDCSQEHLGSSMLRFWYDPGNPLLAPLIAAETWAFFADRFPLPAPVAETRELEPLPVDP